MVAMCRVPGQVVERVHFAQRRQPPAERRRGMTVGEAGKVSAGATVGPAPGGRISVRVTGLRCAGVGSMCGRIAGSGADSKPNNAVT